MTELILPKLSYQITGLCFHVHNELGRFCSERQYADKLEQQLKEAGIAYQREVEINSFSPDAPKGNRADFVIEEQIVVDAKAKKFIVKDDYYQMLRYLQASKLKLGLIVNFRNTYLRPRRVLNATLIRESHTNDANYSNHSRVHS